MLQAEAKYYCVDELVLGTEQSLGKLGVEVRIANGISLKTHLVPNKSMIIKGWVRIASGILFRINQ